jgi:hypothetical protein
MPSTHGDPGATDQPHETQYNPGLPLRPGVPPTPYEGNEKAVVEALRESQCLYDPIKRVNLTAAMQKLGDDGTASLIARMCANNDPGVEQFAALCFSQLLQTPPVTANGLWQTILRSPHFPHGDGSWMAFGGRPPGCSWLAKILSVAERAELAPEHLEGFRRAAHARLASSAIGFRLAEENKLPKLEAEVIRHVALQDANRLFERLPRLAKENVPLALEMLHNKQIDRYPSPEITTILCEAVESDLPGVAPHAVAIANRVRLNSSEFQDAACRSNNLSIRLVNQALCDRITPQDRDLAEGIVRSLIKKAIASEHQEPLNQAALAVVAKNPDRAIAIMTENKAAAGIQSRKLTDHILALSRDWGEAQLPLVAQLAVAAGRFPKSELDPNKPLLGLPAEVLIAERFQQHQEAGCRELQKLMSSDDPHENKVALELLSPRARIARREFLVALVADPTLKDELRVEVLDTIGALTPEEAALILVTAGANEQLIRAVSDRLKIPEPVAVPVEVTAPPVLENPAPSVSPTPPGPPTESSRTWFQKIQSVAQWAISLLRPKSD